MAGQARLAHLSRSECVALLGTSRFGRLAVGMGGDAAPIVRPVNYVFDEASQSVAFRTGLGSKLHALTHGRHAAFEVDAIDLEARTGWSVIVVGVTERVIRPAEVRRLEAHGLETWAPGESQQWVRIRAFTVSGRRIERDAERVGG